ncbi:desmoplakin-like isoform X1 [Brienomyrus brachyistius]|uniref:desmoplakin-like isoform X1 n=1 Tax=Brienomyrus brachyistius TaxID=42636 RepID=UPI0020B25588|nr:desmoplakin-like isoform X1 [Brienomyrus brachyistius]
MSYYDSQSKLHTLEKRSGDISSFVFGRGETAAGNGYGADLMENYGTYRTITKTVSGGPSQVNILHQRASSLQAQCQEYLQKADYLLQSGGGSGRSKMEIEKCIGMANNLMQEMHLCAVELQNLGQPNDVIFQSLDQYQEMMQRIHYAIGGTLQRRKSLVTREDPSRNFQEAMAWIGQQKRLVETSSWGDDPSAIEQQIFNQNKFHSSIQRSPEMERAREELLQKRDKANLNMLEQEWESLQRMSCNRTNQLRELQAIIEEISREIMWVNEREEEELVSDWGDKNIDTYIPNRQENYSKLMCVLEEKERDLNKLKQKVDGLLQSGHPASEKIEAYMDTLQTQWSWLLQITKCINVHLKENAAYSQFFKDANETYSKLQNQHDTMRKRFACNRGTPLETLQELLKNLEREKERLTENKRQVQLLMSKSKNIVRLKPRNPEEKASGPVIVKALCDFKQDQKVILNGDEGILKDNSQRSKWQVTGPGGLDMLVPSVCLLVPPPNPLSIALANKNEQYYEAILALFNQLFINIKSLMSWQLCLKDIGRINSLTISMFRRMRPEEYRGLIRSLETNYQEFQRNYLGSEMFGEEDKRNMDTQYTGAQAHYNKLVVQLPGYEGKEVKEVKEVPEVKEVNEVMEVKMVKEVKLEAAARPAGTVMSRDMTILTELHNLRLRLEASEMGLTQYLHVPLRENSVQECSQRIVQLETLYRDVGTIRDEYLRLKEKTLKQLEGMTDADKAKFLETELTAINQKLGSLEGFSTAYLDRLKALQTLFQSMLQAEDIIKVHEARLTEKDTTSQDPRQVEDYLGVLKQMRMELEQKRDVLNATETKLNNVVRCNSQISQSFHKCDVDLSKYSERVGQMNDRWRRIMAQIDNRSQDLEKYLQLLRRYIQTSSTLDQWIDETGKRQDKLQAAKIDDVRVLMENLNQQKALNSEIKGKRTTVEDVQRDADTCVVSIKDYERQLAAYGAGLETLLNIPVRQTLLQSPATGISVEMGNLQSRYIELLTRSSDYYKFLGEMLKNMEELKMRNTRIDLLDEELKRLKGDIEDRNRKNKSLEDALARSEWELTQSKEQLIILEKVKKSQDLEKSATKEDLSTSFNQVKDLNEQVIQLKSQIEEEKRKRMLAEETYSKQQEEYEQIVRKRQKELEEVNWMKIDIEKTIKDKEREIERLNRQLEDEMARQREFQSELSKVRDQHKQDINNIKTSYESQIQVTKVNLQSLEKTKNEDFTGLRMQHERLESERGILQEENRRLKVLISETDELRKKAEEEAHQQKSSWTEECRRRKELEMQIQTIIQQRNEDDARYKKSMAETTTTLQDKNRQVTLLTQNAEDELRKKRSMDAENARLNQALTELQAKLAASADLINKLKSTEQDLTLVTREQERLTGEKGKLELHSVELQSRINDFKQVVDRLENELEKQRKETQDEATGRKRLEAELDRLTQTCREYTSTITVLKRQQEETTNADRRKDQELRRLQDTLDQSMRDQKSTRENTDSLSAELKALQQQLRQEQARVKEANLRNETLYRTIEEKSKVLNDNTTEIEKLQTLTQNLTKERLRLEEELRNLKMERDELMKKESSEEVLARIASLQVQLQSSSKSIVELKNLIDDLTKEKTMLKMEMEKVQKQAIEKSRVLHDSQTQYNDLLREKENLVANIKMLEQDKSKVQRYDDEMNRMKTTLESEQREKQRLLDEKSRISKDFNYWKTQYELKDDQVRKCNSEKDSIERERNSLKIEIERLMSELKALDERYKLRLSSTEKEVTGLTVTKETLEKELWRLKQEKTVDPSMLVFDGVRKNVTAPQLCDCRVIDNATLNQLINGKKTVQDVAVDIQVNLKGTGIIAGITGGPEGKMSITEAKNKNLLTPQSATMLLEAQAATGYIIDPKQNEKMTVDMAYAKGLVDAQDRDKLITAEAASTGFKDPLTGKLLSVGQAMRKGLIDKESTLRLLQAQEAVGGILDPVLSVFLPKDVALDRGLIDDDLYRALNMRPECYIDPANQQKRCYIDLKMKSKPDFGTGLLLLSDIDKPIEVPGLRKQVPVLQLVNANLLTASDVDGLKQGKITKEDIMHRLRSYLRGSSCIAGTYDNAKQRPLSFYQAMKEGLLKPGTTLELLEAQAASGFLIDPVNNLYLTVEEALQKGLVGIEFKDNLLSAERAVTGYKNPRTDETISLFQAIEKGLIQKGHGIRLLEAQIASGGIIDPTYSHRIDVDVAYRQGYLDREMNDILSRESDETKGFFDPNTEENLTYRQLKQRCIPDTKTGLLLLPLKEQKGTQQLRKRRVVIVDPDTKIEMTVREAFEKQFIDYETYLELSSQECEWEETTFSGPDGSTRLIITDKKTGVRYDIQDCLSKGILDQATVDKYRAGKLTLKEFADKLTRKAGAGLFSDSISSVPGGITKSTQSQITSISSTTSKHVSSLSMTLSKSADGMTEQSPIGAIFDSATLEKLSISEAQRRGIIDSITAQRLLEAQACTGGIINPTTGRRLLLQDAVYQGFIDEDMAARLKPAQKAYAGFEDVKTQRMMSVAEAMKEKWLPYDAGQRFIEYQYVTGGLVDPQLSQRISLEDAIQKGWVDARGAQRLQDIKQHAKSLTCLKTKLKISYKEALDNSLVEENSGVMMLQASSMSSKGISSSYNVSSAPVSQSGSHSDSWDGSGRGSVDHSSMFRYSYTYSSNTHS